MRSYTLSGEKPVIGRRVSVRSANVFDQDLQGFLRQDSVPLGTVLGSGNMNTAFGHENVAATQVYKFTYPDSGGIKECDLCFVFDVCNRIDDCIHLFFSGNTGEDCIVFQERHLVFIPVPFQDIMPEMMELGDMDVDRTIPDLTVVPEMIHVRTDLGPGDITYRLGKLSFDPFDELDQVADVSGNGSVRKIAEREKIIGS